ncbi:hypothetical protein [Actinobacillus genomosp. 1]|nr:hypothetical protein [Actinobacillus genomosp. 1]WGE92162.1 hypothetical protein NYR63_04200 [Actinobacillus genomosp. 1]
MLGILQILAVNQPLALARVGHSRHRGDTQVIGSFKNVLVL